MKANMNAQPYDGLHHRNQITHLFQGPEGTSISVPEGPLRPDVDSSGGSVGVGGVGGRAR